VTIDPNQPARLVVGPPLRAIADVTPEADDEVSIDLSIVGSQGGSYTIGREDGLEPPGFEVLDASGAVVWSGDFEYG
jgi:hypothetical protein